MMKNYKEGHKKRLREKIILDNGQSLLDYEVLEHILYSAYSRIDVKPLAKSLIESFGSLNKVFNADLEALQNVDGVSNAAISAIFCVKKAFVRSAREEIKNLPVIDNCEKLLDYLRISIGSLNKKNSRVIYMNKKYRLIAEDLQNIGTVDQTPLYVREIIKRALLIGSTSIVISRNHPIFYVLRTGCQWRYLPNDFPPWKTVYEQFRKWKKQGIFEKMNYDISKYSKSKMGRNEEPNACIVDSQSVKTTEKGESKVMMGVKK